MFVLHITITSVNNIYFSFSNTDNTSEEGINESYLENFIQEFKTLIANAKNFQNKNRENFDTNNIGVPEYTLENKLSTWFTSTSDSEVWKKGNELIVRDSILSGLRERKMLFRRKIKTRFFPGERIQEMYF